MYTLINEERWNKIRQALKNDAFYKELTRQSFILPAHEIAKRPGIRQKEDSQDWWRCTHRLEKVGIALLMEPENDALRNWLHDALMEVAHLPDDMWIGPFFRPRTNPPQGMLEVSHIILPVFIVLGIVPDILNQAEQRLLLSRVREVGAPYSMNWMKDKEEKGLFERNNWSMALLKGYCAAGLMLEDKEILDYSVTRFNRLCNTANSDFYGETLDYWSYAFSSLASIHLAMQFVRPDLAQKLQPLTGFANALPWVAAQYLGHYRVEAAPELEMPRFMPISDTNALWRPSSTALALIATMKEAPERAALASWLFHETYTLNTLVPKEEGRLGFWSSPDFWLWVLYPDFPNPTGASPLPKVQRFGDGITISHQDALYFACNAGSTEKPRVVSHRHADQGAIFAMYNNVVLLDDPSRVCYRLPLYNAVKEDQAHSLPLFRKDGERLPQRILAFEDAMKPPRNQDAGHELFSDGYRVTCDMGALYPAPIKKVFRQITVRGNHLALVEDHWEADAPVEAATKFVFNNRDMAMAWSIGQNECRMTRENVGVRVISLDEIKPELSYGTLNDANHVNPAAPVQGREGSAYEMNFNALEPAKHGNLRFVLLFDNEEALDMWQVRRTPNGIVTMSPEGVSERI